MPMSSTPNKIVSPQQPSPTPKCSELKDINTVIDEIDELMKKQTSSENKRQEALATTASARREIDFAQDLLHTSLQRISNVDDDTFHARAVLSTKEEALKKVKTQAKVASEERQKVDSETSALGKFLEQQASLIADLQRKLLQQGITPENILKLQKEARDKARHIVAASMPQDFSRQDQKKEPQRKMSSSGGSQTRGGKRRMKFPLFGKAT